MVNPVCSYISNIFDGNENAYLYIWVSKKLQCIYVGQTNELRGSIGRARSHIGSKGTLRNQVEVRIGEKIEVADDLTLLTFLLPRDKKYTGIESSYREAVEYLVQIKLLEGRGMYNPIFKIVSNVRTSIRTSENSVNTIANDIILGFSQVYAKIC